MTRDICFGFLILIASAIIFALSSDPTPTLFGLGYLLGVLTGAIGWGR